MPESTIASDHFPREMTKRAAVAAATAAPPRTAPRPLVLDPVLAASSGAELLDEAGRELLRTALLPRTTLLTPNLPEAAQLLRSAPAADDEAIERQGRALLALGAAAVLIKGGHRDGPHATDILVTPHAPAVRFTAPRVRAERRGTGCALAAAIAAGLARGRPLVEACELAKRHVTELLRAG